MIDNCQNAMISPTWRKLMTPGAGEGEGLERCVIDKSMKEVFSLSPEIERRIPDFRIPRKRQSDVW